MKDATLSREGLRRPFASARLQFAPEFCAPHRKELCVTSGLSTAMHQNGALFYSITSSAMTSSVSGTVSPSALAASRLIQQAQARLRAVVASIADGHDAEAMIARVFKADIRTI